MSSKMQTVYEILGTDDAKLVNDVLNELSSEERTLCNKRWGNDLENPILNSSWNSSDSMAFHTKLIPHMKEILKAKIYLLNSRQVTIYELLKTERKDLVEQIISELDTEDRTLLERRYGKDLENPVLCDDWKYNDTKNFYSQLIPKMQDMLKNKETEEIPILDDKMVNEEVPISGKELLEEEHLKTEIDIKELKVTEKEKRGRKPQTIYQLLKTDDKELVNELINSLSEDEKKLFWRRNGKDLNNPTSSDDWASEDAFKFRDKVIKKMRRMLITKQNGEVSKYLSIYQLLNTDDDILIQKVLSKLKPKEQELFWKRNGNDLNNPMPSDDYTYLDEDRFNVNLVVKMRKIMNEEKLKQNEDISPEILDINDVEFKTDNSEKGLENITEEIMETEEKQETIEIKLNDNNALPYFDKVLRKLSIKEAVIASLKLVLNFSTDDISKFLNIETKEIKNIVKNSLISYKTYFTHYVDSLIEESENPILVEEKDYIKAINNLSFGELLDRLPLKDTIIVCLSLGLVNEKMYSVDEISNFLLITREEVIKMNKNALLVYKQIINDNINNLIEIVTGDKSK